MEKVKGSEYFLNVGNPLYKSYNSLEAVVWRIYWHALQHLCQHILQTPASLTLSLKYNSILHTGVYLNHVVLIIEVCNIL